MYVTALACMLDYQRHYHTATLSVHQSNPSSRALHDNYQTKTLATGVQIFANLK